jgi:hypothetical protein
MFFNPRNVELLPWHVKRKTDGKIQHPVDGRQWKHFDLAHQEDFSNDPRNIRSGLSTDRKHRYHQWKTQFDGTIDNEEALKHRDVKFVFEMIKNIKVIFEKPMKGENRKKNEKAPKDSLFKK